MDRGPAFRTELFGKQSGWQFGAGEADVKDCLPRVVIVRVHFELGAHVFRSGLRDVALVELEGKERQADPRADYRGRHLSVFYIPCAPIFFLRVAPT